MESQSSETNGKGKELLLRAGRRFYEFFELFCVILFAMFAVMSISEIASRESFSTSVESKLSALDEDLANIAINISMPLNASTAPTLSEENLNSRTEAIESKRYFEKIKDRASTLINTGVDAQEDSLKAITREYQGALNDIFAQEISGSNIPASEQGFFSAALAAIYTMRSDHLLALAIVTSSALGAMIFGLRNGLNMSIRTITSGLATGFVVYLALKGGQHLFLITSPEVRIPANPFSSAFAGLLAGLFSDKAYRMLTLIVDNLASKVESSNASPAPQAQNNKEKAT